MTHHLQTFLSAQRKNRLQRHCNSLETQYSLVKICTPISRSLGSRASAESEIGRPEISLISEATSQLTIRRVLQCTGNLINKLERTFNAQEI